MRRVTANAAATADALLAWLGTQTRSGAAVAPSESDGHPTGVVSAQDGAGGDGVADALTHDVPVTALAVGASTIAARPVERAEAQCRATSMRLAHTDWLHHRLAIIGMAEQLAAFRRAAVGAGVVPWQLDLDRMEEDVFHLLAAPSSAAHAERGRGTGAGRTNSGSRWPSSRTRRRTCGGESGVSIRSACACPGA